MKIIDKTKQHPYSIFATVLRLCVKWILFYNIAEWYISGSGVIIFKYITDNKSRYALLLLACSMLYWLVNQLHIETHSTRTITKTNGDKVITGWRCKWW